ncbi:hypothetical protein CARUB_v10021574mg [Capsella rubella]|uniref:S-protein homolog n=1 Tax=Capsella rubella TaxID=81985 RepID=R0IBS1_9BRAS|nr:hypothetical protein CARUB_v10021574mg [Capsella rubella]
MKISSKTLVVLSIMFCYVISLCHGSFRPFTKTVVTLTNNISPPTVLTLNCTSKSDVLTGNVPPGQKYLWKFIANWWLTTKFTCRFSWANQVKWFDVYTADRDQGNCFECNWSIMADRLCSSGYLDQANNRCYQY